MKKKPGVYIDYTVAPSSSRGQGGKSAVILGFDSSELGSKEIMLGSQDDIKKLLAEEKYKKLRLGAEILFKEGATKCYVLISGAREGFLNSLKIAEEKEDARAVILDEKNIAYLAEAVSSCKAMSNSQRERFLFLGFAELEEAIRNAKEICSERVIITAGVGKYEKEAESFFLSCESAGKLLAMESPEDRLSILELEGVFGLAKAFQDTEIERAIDNGVTVFEELPYGACLVKMLTTRTMTGEIMDRSLTPLSNVLKTDYIMRKLRELLYGLIKGTKKSLSYENISSRICVLLAELRERGIIESFASPSLRPSESDPSICVAELSFKLGVSVDTIHISTRIII